MLTLEQLNLLDDVQTAAHFRRCCASNTWVDLMVKSKAYISEQDLLSKAKSIWQSLEEEDYLQAFDAHPKIGDVSSLKEKYADTHILASNEQAGAQEATELIIAELAAGNQEYEAKFGFIFIVFATGKSAAEMLDLLKQRLPNTREQEIQNAADNQAKITEQRLKKLLGMA